MSDSRKTTKRPVRISPGVKILFAMLIAWGALMAWGTFQTQASTDFRRPLIVAATMTLFLAIWICALLMRRKQ